MYYGADLCQFLIASELNANSGIWLLGDNFLRAYYAIFDMDENRVGLIGDSQVARDPTFSEEPQVEFTTQLGETIVYTLPEVFNGIGSSIYTTTRSTILAEFADYDEGTNTLRIAPYAQQHVGTFEFKFQLYYNAPPTRKQVFSCVLTVEGPELPIVFDGIAAVNSFDSYFYYWLDSAARAITP